MADRERRGIRLRLPATSANLGPGFDAVGLALSMYLTVEAWPAEEWTVEATGRDADVIAKVDDNLMVKAYQATSGLLDWMPPLRLKVHNEIPLGMGCGSSAAAICAGVALAAHFGKVSLYDDWVATKAAELEGHPDNVAACWYGGFTVSAMSDGRLATATFAGDPTWQMMLAMPGEGLATKKARAMLPESYSRADTVFNVQRAALLTAAFAQRRLDLLRVAMQDRLHQPYRAKACGLLEELLPLAGPPGVAGSDQHFAGVALSGAGPSVLAVLAEETTVVEAEERLRQVVGGGVELLPVRIADGVEREVLETP